MSIEQYANHYEEPYATTEEPFATAEEAFACLLRSQIRPLKNRMRPRKNHLRPQKNCSRPSRGRWKHDRGPISKVWPTIWSQELVCTICHPRCCQCVRRSCQWSSLSCSHAFYIKLGSYVPFVFLVVWNGCIFYVVYVVWFFVSACFVLLNRMNQRSSWDASLEHSRTPHVFWWPNANAS